MAELATILAEIADRMAKAPERGQVATYIPELAKVDPGQFGIAVATVDGQVLAAGDADVPFSIQSVSKVFTLTLALGKVGDALWRRVGREPSGSAFNSIVQLEREHGIPRNPFINAGAIVVADTRPGRPPAVGCPGRDRQLPAPGRRRRLDPDRPGGGALRDRAPLPQRRARQLPAQLRQPRTTSPNTCWASTSTTAPSP